MPNIKQHFQGKRLGVAIRCAGVIVPGCSCSMGPLG